MAGTVSTALAAAILSISSANLGAISDVASGSNNAIALDPSLNLQVNTRVLLERVAEPLDVFAYLT